MRSFYVVKCDEDRLAILEHLSSEDFHRLANAGGFIVWDYCGLKLLIPAFRVRNMVEFMQQQDKFLAAAGVFCFTQVAAIRLTPELAEAITGCP